MDVPGLLILLGGLVFLVLVVFAIRSMARKRIGEGERPGALPSPEDEALAKEALGETSEGAAESGEKEETGEAQAKILEGRQPPRDSAVVAMRRGLDKTRRGFMGRLNQLLFKELDASLVDDLEALLVTSDIGIRTSQRLLADIREQLSRKEIGDASVVREKLREKIKNVVNVERRPLTFDDHPTVIMVIGVNGVGKTTTIGKLAARLSAEGKKVVLGAGDTFRAAAVEQLEIWGERSGAQVVRGPEGADPASVVFEAIQRARASEAHVCICDTAGRLHTKVNLMEELKKLRRVMQKAMPGAPHEVIMVLDATTGQNGIAQARQFKEAVEVNSIALTKLDGTAKGGVAVAICDELALPVRYVGIGEKIEDLRDFDAEAFVDALFATDDAAESLANAS